MRRVAVVQAAVLLSLLPALAQQSASYNLEESVLNAGGHPLGGTTLGSTSFHVKLDSIGEGAVRTGLTSASWHVDISFASAYPPPGEARNLKFTNKTTLAWDPEESVGHYEVYRDLLTTLSGGGTGTCFAPALTSSTTNEPADPTSGQAWFYLATARNRLDEEGTKGFRSSGMERPNAAPCP